MSQWSQVPLGEVIQVKHGFAFPGRDFSDDTSLPTLVTPGNFAIGGGFQPSKPKTFGGSVPSEYVLQPDDLLITMTDLSKQGDTLGLPALVPNDGRTYLHNQRIGLVQIIDPDAVNCRFLSYFLRTADYRAHILGTSSGSTVKHTSPSRILSYRAGLPPFAEQRAIADVLGALDDKIAVNRKLIAAADKLRKSKFLDLFSDPGMLPLSATADFINGKAFTKGASGTGRVVIRIAELNSGLGSSTVYNDIDVPNEHVARPGDLLFAWSGSLTVHRWYRPEAVVNQHIFKVVPKDGFPMWLVACLLERKLEYFVGVAANKATTMGHIQRRHLDELVGVPSEEAIARVDGAMTGLWQAALSAEIESESLATLRDTLLPALMSGRLRVRDAEKSVEAV